MKLFKKILSAVLSLGVLLSSTYSLHIFAWEGENIPTTLEESCLALDKICNQEEKNEIKNSLVDQLSGYCFTSFGYKIRSHWLYSYEKNKPSQLADLLLKCGIGFTGNTNLGYEMVKVILYNYRHYLMTGTSLTNIEDLIIDFYFSCECCSSPDFKRKIVEEKLKTWKNAKESHKDSVAPNTSSWQCTIL